MAYRLIYSEFWTDPKVMEEMNPAEKYFFLYILTNPSTTSCGIYSVTKKQMACELGYTVQTVNNLLNRFENHYELIAYNPDTRELAVKNWGRYNLSRGGKPVMDCLASELSKVKDKWLIKYVQKNISSQVITKLYQEFCDTASNRERNVPRQGDNTNTNTYTYTDTVTNTRTITDKDTGTESDAILDAKDTVKDRVGGKEEDKVKDKGKGKVKDVVKDTVKHTAEDSTSVPAKDIEAHNQSLSIVRYYEKVTGKIAVLNLAAVKLAVMQHGQKNVERAIDKALEKGKLSMSYINGILKIWAKEGYPKEGESSVNGGSCKDFKTATGGFSGFEPSEPKRLTGDEQRAVEEILL